MREAQRPAKPTPASTTTAVKKAAAAHTVVLCDVESVATALREAGLDIEDAPAALAAAAGEAGARRVYALGNRFSRLRRVLENAGYERVSVDGPPASLRLQLAVDAVDLSHRDPSASFLLATTGDEIQPLIERLAGEGRSVALFGPEMIAGRPEPADRQGEGGREGGKAASTPMRSMPEDPEPEVPEEDAEPEARDPELRDEWEDETSSEETEDRTGDEELDEDDEDLDEDPYEDRDDDDSYQDLDDGAYDDDDDDDGDLDQEPRRRVVPVKPADRAPSRGAPAGRTARAASGQHDVEDPFELLLAAVGRIVQGPPQLVFESIVRQEILEVEPRFNERTAGFGSFTEFLEEARERGLVEIVREPATGTYLVVGARIAG